MTLNAPKISIIHSLKHLARMATAMSSPTSLHIWADMILRGADDAEMILLSSAPHMEFHQIFFRRTALQIEMVFRRRFNSGNCYTQPPCYDGVYDVGIVAKIQKLLRQLKSRIGSADLWREYWKFLFVTPPSLSLFLVSLVSLRSPTCWFCLLRERQRFIYHCVQSSLGMEMLLIWI